MSFFKKLKSEFLDKDKDSDQARGYGGQQSNDYYQQQQQQQPQYQQQQYQQQQYPPQQYPPMQQAYQQPVANYNTHPSYQQYGGPAAQGYPPQPQYQPPTYPPPPAGPAQLPAGWLALWSQQYNFWYYVDQSTGRVQWAHPYAVTAPNEFLQQQQRGYDPAVAAAPMPSAPYSQPQGSHEYVAGEVEVAKEKKDKDHSNEKMLAAGVAGLAIGGVAGAVIAHEMTEDDSSEHNMAPPPPDQYTAPPPAPPPALDSDVESAHEEMNEAQAELQSAQADLAAADSRSDIEEAQEKIEDAQDDLEEAQSDLEEAYDD